jgi:hypothetical protein
MDFCKEEVKILASEIGKGVLKVLDFLPHQFKQQFSVSQSEFS